MTKSQTPISNETIETLLNRRSIRAFKPNPVPEQTVATLETVAQHAASSEYLQDWSAIRVKDQVIKRTVAEIGNQAYIAQAPLLYVFVADEHRNAAIAARKGIDPHSDQFTLNSSYRFSQAQNDAVLALHAMETAAYSLGLGAVILGSILNDPTRLVELLHLPEFTYPVLGLALGEPDQAPSLKPRMDRSAQFFDDSYPANDKGDTPEIPGTFDLDAFDKKVSEYYDLRDTKRPVDAFSDQIAAKSTDSKVIAKRFEPVAKAQGFRFDR